MAGEISNLSGVDTATAQHQQPETDMWSNFRDSAAYTAVQVPLDGVTQLIDDITGSHLQESMQFIEAPKQAEFLSANWTMQQLGAGAGMLPWIFAINKSIGSLAESSALAGTRATLSKYVGASEAQIGISKMFATGAVYDGVLVPVDHSSDEDWRVARGLNALTGGTTWAALAGAQSWLSNLGKSPVWANKMTLGPIGTPALAALANNKVATAVVASVPAGVASANMDSFRFEGQPASLQAMLETTTQLAVVGGTLSLVPGGARRPATDLEPLRGTTNNRVIADIAPAAEATSVPDFVALEGDGPVPGSALDTAALADGDADMQFEPPAESTETETRSARLTPEQLAQYEIGVLTDGTDLKWTEIYQEAFPESERQAEGELIEHYKSGHMELSETRDPNGRVVGMIASEVFEPNENRPKIILNAYTATAKDVRSTGIGSAMMEETIRGLQANHPEAPAWFAEIEAPDEPGITPEQMKERADRWRYYE